MIGGIGQVSVLLSLLMGGISGSAVADAAMEARVLGPEMIKRGYPRGYAASQLCFTSMIVATIPPAIGLIIYGFVGNVSIGKLFVAGIIPGLMMAVMYFIVVHITSKKHNYDPPAPNAKLPTFKEIFTHLKKSIWALLFPLILIIGIRFGVFTPSEAGAFAVVYAIVIGLFVYRELSFKGFLLALKDSFIDTGGILMIIALSGIFGHALTIENTPGVLGSLLFGITSNPQLLIFIVIIFLVIIGLFIDSNVICLLFTPIILPVLIPMGVDPVHFGIIMMTMVTMGVFTPPVGTGIYVVCSILDCPIDEYMKECLPFLLTLIGLDIFFIFIPDIILWLPNLVFSY
jgi:tripartite ATP-independent transporter DctM subunit